jgi:F-type H+-transporting ATPase subunit b
VPATFIAGPGVHLVIPASILAADEGDSEAETEGTGEATIEEDDPPNPILPVGNELIWNLGAFLVLVLLMKFVAYPAVKRGIEARDAGIKADLDAATTAKAHADSVLTDYQARMAQARAEANQIIEEARRSVEAARSEQLAALNAELATMRAQANEDISASKAAALAQLQGGVAEIAVGAAERVVGHPIDRERELRSVETYLRDAAEGSTR